MNNYATLEQAKGELKSDIDDDDTLLMLLIEQVSRRVDLEMDDAGKPMFVPTKTTKKLPVQSWRLEENGQTYNPHFPLQALEAANAVLINGTTDITSKVEVGTDYRLHWKFTEVGDFLNTVASIYGVKSRLWVAGTWVFHNAYADSWTPVDTLSAAIVSASATTITVSAPSSPDIHGHTPRIAPGHLIQIDSEWLDVVDVNTGTLTVVRGVNGSTAATHLISAPVSVFHVEPPIAHAVARQVGLLYARRGAFNSTTFDGIGTTQYPEDELAELRTVIANYKAVLSA